MRKTTFLGFALLGLFCFEARAERTVHATVPISAFNVWERDSVIYLSLHNPSQVAQTVTMTIKASGDFYFSNRNTAGVIDGTNQWSCNRTLAQNDSAVKSCTMLNPVLEPGANRLPRIRVRRANSGHFPADTGVSLTITVQGNDGFILAAGGTFIESYDGVAYTGGPFTINGGRPF